MTPEVEGRPNDLRHAAFPEDFLDFVHALNAHAVEYVLVGGYAVGVYGHVRATTDIDFFYRRAPDNVARLLSALGAFGAPPVVLDRAHLEAPDTVTAFGEPPTRIDLLSSISGVSFEDAQVAAVHVDINGDVLPVIGLLALRANKLASGRKKDRDDLKRLPDPASPSRHRSVGKPRR